MRSNKKSYAIKILQIALALSLLQGDPDIYLQQRLRSWDSQLELRDGDGWELELLRAVPMVEYPYANRKTMMPLIEDLIRYDRQRDKHNHQNITAYLLVHNEIAGNQTAAIQELQSTTNPQTVSNPSTGAAALEHVTAANLASTEMNVNASRLSPIPDLDMFLNLDIAFDSRPIWEQNLANLSDYGDFSGLNHYNGLPLKDEPSSSTYLDVYLPNFSDDSLKDIKTEGATALNDTFPNPGDLTNIKNEHSNNNDLNEFEALNNLASCSSNSISQGCIKKEPVDSEKDTNDSDPFLTTEESEIVEVLWKQDVDLGFSLTSELQLNSNTGESDIDVLKTKQLDSTQDGNEDINKLKALEELKLDKLKYDAKDNNHDEDIGDEWAGIPFIIDNETGEYIRLPLDELLHDVIQLSELAGKDNETDTDPIASTSKAAAVQSNSKKLNKLDFDGKNVEDKDNIDNNNTNNSNNNNDNNNYKNDGELSNEDDLPQSEIEVGLLPSPLFDLDDEAKEELVEDLDRMIQSATPAFHHPHHHHPHRPTAAGIQNYAVGSGANSAFHRQATGFHHGHHHQGRVSLSRGVSMEQRLQDIANFFNPIPSMGVVGGVSDMGGYPHYPTHPYSYQGATGITAAPQHSQYPPPPPHHHGHHTMLHPNTTLGDLCSNQPHYGHNLGSAVTSSMHLTNASHDADLGAGATGGASNAGPYKMEHDLMYYSNVSSDINHTTDGFINSILNDEDLHLMDMNVSDNFCRMVDINNSTSNNSSVLGLASGHTSTGGGSGTNSLSMNGVTNTAGTGMTTDLINQGGQVGDRLDASSDSAVSSMGSERVPSLSDGEWGEGSDSAQDYHQGKYGGPYDYSYSNNNRLNDGTRQPPVAQKKHQMFGKRYMHDQPSITGATAGVNSTAPVNGMTPSNPLLHGPAQSIKYEYEPYTATGLHQNSNGIGIGEGAMVPVLNKDQQTYDMKYSNGTLGSYSIDYSIRQPRTSQEIVHHNHSYTLPQGTGSLPRPQLRDKKLSTSSSSIKSSKSVSSSEDEHLTRDEKRARALNIPIPVMDIINLPMDEFNERLSKYDLTENQLSLIRDIRRRGKNKVAAQNCRKRKLDQIISLEDEVKEVRKRKDELQSDLEGLSSARKHISNKFAALHRHIFQYLRDSEGNPCSPSEYSLQQAADGSIFLLPRDSSNKTDAVNGIAATSSNSNNNNNSINGGAHLNNTTTTPLQHPHVQVAGAHQQHTHQHNHNLTQPLSHHSVQLQHQQQQQQQHHQHAHHHHQSHRKD